MEETPKDEIFSEEEKAALLTDSAEGASTIEDQLKNVDARVEEEFYAKKRAEEEERIARLNAELQDRSVPTEAPIAKDVHTVSGEDAAKRILSANQEERYVLAERIADERTALMEVQVPWYRRLFRNDSMYQENGNHFYTKAGNRVEVVTGPDNREYVKIAHYQGGGGDPGHQIVKYQYVSVENAQPFLS